LFVNGTQTAINASDTNSYAQGILRVGADAAPSYYTTGFVSNLRVVKGQALYTSNFTPPASSLTTTANGGASPSTAPTAANVQLLALQTSNVTTDSSTSPKTITASGQPIALNTFPTYTRKAYNNQNDLFSNEIVALTAITGASGWTESLRAGYFDAGSYLTIPNNTAFTLPGDFTIECWWKTPESFGSSGDMNLWQIGTSNFSNNGLLLYKPYGNQLTLWANGAALGVSTVPVVTDRWYHIAVVRSGNSLKLYINGVAGISLTNSITWTSNATNGFTIGAELNPTILLSAHPQYISNLRIVKGEALYTEAFSIPTSRLSTSSNGGATPSVAPVPSNVVLLACQTASVYDDNSFSPKTISRTGDVVMTQYQSLAQVGKVAAAHITPWSNNAGYWGGYFDTVSYVNVANNTAFTVGTSNFTIECWWQSPSTTTGTKIWCLGTTTSPNNGLLLYADTGSNLKLWSNGALLGTSTIAHATNTWYHLAVVRTGTTLNLYINGQVGISITNSTSFASHANNGFFISGESAGSITASGNSQYISNLRVVKGQALYTSAFTPSTIPLTTTTNGNAVGATTTPAASAVSLLTLQSNKFVDNSSTPKAITATGTPKSQTHNPFTSYRMQKTSFHSGWFDGASYLTAPASTAYTLSGDFTIECWVNTSVFSADTNARHLISMGTGTDATNLLKIGLVTTAGAVSNVISLYTTSAILVGSIVVANGGWHHIAVTRSGTNLRLYIDGVQSGSTVTTSQSFNAGATTNIQIGRINSAESGRFNGYISNLRIINGTAVYTGAFTPPIAPVYTSGATSATSYSTLTNVNTTFAASQCSLLLDFDDAGVMDSSGNTAISTYFEARTSEAQSKWIGKQSLYFDGTNYMTYVPLNNFGTGDFTVEAWVYPSNAAAQWYVVDARNSDQTTNWVFGQYPAAGRLSWWNGTAWVVATTTQVTTTSAWNHIMYTRASGVGRVYCNGAQVATAADATNYSVIPTSSFVGAAYNNTSNFNGYIDDLRITTGIARATGLTYTVPVKPAAVK
jgi:hypothetical protein